MKSYFLVIDASGTMKQLKTELVFADLISHLYGGEMYTQHSGCI